jgi:hypothetical protein
VCDLVTGMNDISVASGAWILAFISCSGGVMAATVKLISKNGCRLKCHHHNGNLCCDTDCEQGRSPSQVAQKNIELV